MLRRSCEEARIAQEMRIATLGCNDARLPLTSPRYRRRPRDLGMHETSLPPITGRGLMTG